MATIKHARVHGDDTTGDDAVLLLVCGLPGAGKSTLAHHVAATAHASPALHSRQCVIELLSFDELFVHAASSDNDSKFDPAVWKQCQRLMAERVRAWHHSALTHQQSDASRRQLVLLVDDNFQYRSLRKRFAHLAAERAYHALRSVCVCWSLRRSNALADALPPQSTAALASYTSIHHSSSVASAMLRALAQRASQRQCLSAWLACLKLRTATSTRRLNATLVQWRC